MLEIPIDFYGLFAFLSFFFCLVILIVFILHNEWSRLSNKMLFMALLSFAVAASFAFLSQTKMFGEALGGIQALGVSFYLVMPFTYLYISKWPNEKWKRQDSLHFVAAAIYLIQYIPLSNASDQAQAQAHVFAENFYFYLRSSQWVAYSIAMIYAYRSMITKAEGLPKEESQRMLIWINVFIGILAVTAVAPLFARLEHAVDHETMFYVFANTSAFILCTFMLINPGVLYGLPVQMLEFPLRPFRFQDEHEENIDPGDIPELRPKKITLSQDQIDYMQKKLREFMMIRKPFLHQKYTLQQLSSDSGFPLYQLSLYLNRNLGMNFNSYINKLRIEFLLESYKRNQDKWNRFTLEAIAHEIGFNNRTSFIQAFKKVTGQNPSVYFKNLHGHEISE